MQNIKHFNAADTPQWPVQVDDKGVETRVDVSLMSGWSNRTTILSVVKRFKATGATADQTCNWFQWNRLRIRNRFRFVWIQNRNRLRSTIFPLESESDSTPLVLEQNRSRMKKSEMAWSRLRIRNQTFEASLESESDSTPLGTWLSGIGVGINYCWVEVESESTPADRNQLQVCCRQDYSVQEEVGTCEEGGRSCEEEDLLEFQTVVH